MKDVVIFDLDGTLALIEARRQLALKPNGKLNWDIFFDPKNIKMDNPNMPVISMFKALKKEGFTMMILSGRDSRSIRETTQWLHNHEIFFDALIMRPRGSYTPDDILKKDWLDEIGADRVFCVFDDRDKVVQMWRDNGLTCFQVNYGNF